jgi:hypothetical protein
LILGTNISTRVKDGARLVKALFFGKDDVREISEIAPAGIDANPVKDMVGLYCDTTVKGDGILIGWINVNQLAQAGEVRLYSQDSNGAEKARFWVRNDGKIEVGGTGARGSNTNHAAQFEGLQTAYNDLQNKYNMLAQKWNAFCAAYVPGSPSTTGLPATLSSSSVSQSTADITGAKLTNILTE